MFRFKLVVAVGVGVGTLLLCRGASADLSTPNSTLRKVTNGVGNCIFSTASLPFEKESTYSGVKEAFTSPDRLVEVRCYQAKRTMDYASQGAVYNQIRDDNTWHNYVTVESISGKHLQYEQLGEYHPSDDSNTWDQMRMKVWNEQGKCNFKDRSDLGTDGCLDVEKQVRALAAKDGGKLPYTGKVCVSLYFKWTDTYNEVLGADGKVVSRERTRVEPQYMAQSCAQYTVE